MRPLQENQSRQRPTMRLRDPISSYKCFEAIATPSPIATIDGGPTNVNDNRNSNLHRPTSLDSLANSSEEQDSTEDADDVHDISDVDSISDFGNDSDAAIVNGGVQLRRKSDLEELAEMKNDMPAPKEPVIKAYLEKSHRKCDYKNCNYKKSDKDTVGTEKPKENEKKITKSDNDDEDKSSDSPQNSCANSTVSSTNNNNSKTRRISIASSGSVGRMETIVEEPIESKISVKEILARFETLNSLEVKH